MSNTRSKDLKLVPLFGRLTDMRSKLFISALREASDKLRGGNSYKATKLSKNGTDYGVQGNIYLSEVTYQFQNKYFINKDSGKGDDDIHSEWSTYFNNIKPRIASKQYKNDTDIGKSIINLIQSVSGIVPVGSEEEFTQELIKMLIENGTRKKPDNTLEPIDINSPSTWTNIEDVTYYPLVIILSKLIIFTPNYYSYITTPLPLMTLADKNINSIPLEARQAYETAIFNGLRLPMATPLTDTAVKFNQNLNKYWLLEQLDEHYKNTKQAINNPSSFFDKEVSEVQQHYFRKNGILHTYDSNGKELQVDITSAAYRELSNDSSKCLDTGFKQSAAPGETCADYLQECLQGKGVEKCKAFLQNQDFWKITQEEVNNMLPVNAVKTLVSFGFDFYSVFDANAGRRFKKFYDVNKWIEKLTAKATSGTSPGLTIADVENITKNLKLTGYLGMIVHKINSNPAILNEDYVGPNHPSQLNNLSFDTTLSKKGLKPRYAVETLSIGDVIKFQNAVTEDNLHIKARFRIPGVHGGIFNTMLMGGGNDLLDTFNERMSDKTKYISSIIANHHISLNKRLEKFGKKIDTSDQKKISDLIENLAESENKLYKASLYAEKYAQLLELHGNNDNTSILTYDHLKEFVDHRNKQFNRVSKKQTDLLSIIRSIAEAVNSESLQSSQKKSQHEDIKLENITALLG